MARRNFHILIVEADFYSDISEKLANGAIAIIEQAGATYERVRVPGAFEIPAAIRLHKDKADGFVALGCVIRGETSHYDIVAGESARGLMDLAVREGLLIGNGILTVDTREQALERASSRNKGGDAARACLRLLELSES